MRTVRPVLGWLSWYIVATVLYAVVWERLDDDFRFAMPAEVVLPLSDFLGATSAESTYDVYLWSTSVAAVVLLHAIAWFISRWLRRAAREMESKWPCRQRLLFSVVGWTCWLLVSTFVLLVIGDEILEARGEKLSNDVREESMDLVVGILVMGLFHLAILMLVRYQKKRAS